MKNNKNPIKDVELEFPCQEDINKMQDENGRKKCEKCKNFLYDFTKMNELEYNEILNNSDKKICGIYKSSQLSDKFLKYAATTFIATTLSSSTQAKNLITYEDHNLSILHKDRILPQFKVKRFLGFTSYISPDKKNYIRYTNSGNTFPNHEYEEVIAQIKKHLKLEIKLEDKISSIIKFEIGLDGNVLNKSILNEINKEIENDIIQAINKVDLNFQPISSEPTSFPFSVYFPFNLFYEEEDLEI